jgi:hypothetical protein
MVSTRSILKGTASAVAIAAASITGGPIVGAQVAAFLATPPGQRLLDQSLDSIALQEGVNIDTLDSEPIDVLIPKKKRTRSKKQKTNDKKKSVAWKKANSAGRKNNGDFRAGWDMKRIAKRANKLLKKL